MKFIKIVDEGCPECWGHGTVTIELGPDYEERSCPRCNGWGKIEVTISEDEYGRLVRQDEFGEILK